MISVIRKIKDSKRYRNYKRKSQDYQNKNDNYKTKIKSYKKSINNNSLNYKTLKIPSTTKRLNFNKSPPNSHKHIFLLLIPKSKSKEPKLNLTQPKTQQKIYSSNSNKEAKRPKPQTNAISPR